MRTLRRTVTTLTLTASLVGCYQYRTSAEGVTPIEGPLPVVGDSGVVPKKSITVWAVAWGLATKGWTKADCNHQGFQEITVRDNFGYTLITVLSLGFVSPKKIEGKCMSPRPSDAPFQPGGG